VSLAPQTKIPAPKPFTVKPATPQKPAGQWAPQELSLKSAVHQLERFLFGGQTNPNETEKLMSRLGDIEKAILGSAQTGKWMERCTAMVKSEQSLEKVVRFQVGSDVQEAIRTKGLAVYVEEAEAQLGATSARAPLMERLSMVLSSGSHVDAVEALEIAIIGDVQSGRSISTRVADLEGFTELQPGAGDSIADRIRALQEDM